MKLKPNERILVFETEIQAKIVEETLDARGFTIYTYLMESLDEDYEESEEFK